MKLSDISNMKTAIKIAKTDIIKLVHRLIFENDENKSNRSNLKNFEGFPFKNGDVDFEKKIETVKNEFDKIQLISIANFFQIEPVSSEEEMAHNIISALVDLESFQLTFTVNSDVEDEADSSEKTNQSSENNNKVLVSPSEITSQNRRSDTLNDPKNLSVTAIREEEQMGKFKMTKKFEKSRDDSDIDLINFSSETGMSWRCWNLYFEGYCNDKGKDNLWKIRNIQRFLKGKALTLYINNSLDVLHWEELVHLFNDEFTAPGEVSLSDFSDISFRIGDDVSEYYYKKIHAGRALGLDSKLLLEGLTDGLPKTMKQLVVVNSPKTTTEWRELVHKLNRMQISENNQRTNFKSPNSNYENPYFCQWRPPRPNTEFNYNPRQGSYRYPNTNNPIRPVVTNDRYIPRGPRPINPPCMMVFIESIISVLFVILGV